MLSRYSRDPLPSQILMPAALRGSEDVEPETNQRSSAITARKKTRLVVKRGRIGSCKGVDRENFRGVGANIEQVPVPVLSGRCSPFSRISRMRFKYWYSSWLGSAFVSGIGIIEPGTSPVTGLDVVTEGAMVSLVSS